MPRISRVLAILISLSALAACARTADPAAEPSPGDATPPAVPTASADLAAARRTWEARKPASYAYTIEVSCFCIHRGTYAVEVRGGHAASLRTEAGESVPADRAQHVPTVDQLFQRIAEAMGEGTPTRVVYDPSLGFPAEAEIGTLANDAGTLYRIRGLRAL